MIKRISLLSHAKFWLIYGPNIMINDLAMKSFCHDITKKNQGNLHSISDHFRFVLIDHFVKKSTTNSYKRSGMLRLFRIKFD